MIVYSGSGLNLDSMTQNEQQSLDPPYVRARGASGRFTARLLPFLHNPT